MQGGCNRENESFPIACRPQSPSADSIIRGITALSSSLPQVQMAVDVKFVQDTLKGDSVTEIRMKFIRRIEDNLPAGEE